MLTRLIYGARNTVGIALVTTIYAFILGGVLGIIAAVLGGWVGAPKGSEPITVEITP